jgi:hypothetical protein
LRLIGTRAQAQHPGELSLHCERAAPRHFRKICQRHRPVAVSGKIAAQLGHRGSLVALAQRTTSLAGAIARRQRSGGAGEKTYIGLSGTPAGTRRPAKYPGAGYGVNKTGACVPRQYLLPGSGWIEIELLIACHARIMNPGQPRNYPYLAGKKIFAGKIPTRYLAAPTS